MWIKNNKFFKKYIFNFFIAIIFFIVFFFLVNKLEFYIYNYHTNLFLNNLIANLEKKYPEITTSDILDLLEDNKLDDNYTPLKEYGIDLKRDSLILEQERIQKISLIVNIIMFLVFAIIMFLFYFHYVKKQKKELDNITNYLESINQGIYKLDIENNEEDELSILRNEIYKITVMLKEQAILSKNDKLALKSSLEDLSHQLKTPLTTISIMLDNINEDGISKNKRKEFIKDMKRMVLNINFLVNSLLKLSKFDANTITFFDQKVYVNDLIKESIQNVSMLAELKNITLTVKGPTDNQITVDFKWQVEAITNILKNCIEYSYLNSSIEIEHFSNKLYASIVIKDHGKGMDKEDLKYLFKRFYKGKNSSSDSIGIGLSLVKTILEHNHASIQVDSILDQGTTFIIKYQKEKY